METSLNLSAERSGRSVWDAPRPLSGHWGLAAIVFGTTMLAAAWRRPGKRWLLAMGAGGLGVGLVASLPVEALRTRIRARRSVQSCDPLDEALVESFPASDPPAASTPAVMPEAPQD